MTNWTRSMAMLPRPADNEVRAERMVSTVGLGTSGWCLCDGCGDVLTSDQPHYQDGVSRKRVWPSCYQRLRFGMVNRDRP